MGKRHFSMSAAAIQDVSHPTAPLVAQVFDQLSSMGSLYQQFHAWIGVLYGKACSAEKALDSKAPQTCELLLKLGSQCERGAQSHHVPLCVLLLKLQARPVACWHGVMPGLLRFNTTQLLIPLQGLHN